MQKSYTYKALKIPLIYEVDIVGTYDTVKPCMSSLEEHLSLEKEDVPHQVD